MKIIELKSKCDLSSVLNSNITNKTEELPVVSDLSFNDPVNDIIRPKSIKLPDFSVGFPYEPEPILSPEEVKEKRKLIIHIKNYIKEFPNCLSEFKSIDYGGKTIGQLQNYLDEIKLTVCHANSGGLLLGVFQGACDVLESAAPIVNYNLTGLKYIATKNPNVINSVKELSLEYQNLNYIPPEKRLALLMFQLCYGLNQVNRVNQKIEEHLNKSVPEKINEKYVEL